MERFIRDNLIGEPMMLSKSAITMLGRAEDMDVRIVPVDAMSYEEVGNIAVISVDGAMAKKTYSGMCMNVYGYSSINAGIIKAESSQNIDTILFRVDTPGGAVSGADDTRDRIKKCSKKTVTIFENVGASAGVYVFGASDEVYATRSTEIGSIGVMALVPKESDSEYLTYLSPNAENKSCGVNRDCKDKIMKSISYHEKLFISSVAEDSGMSEDEVISGFNNGDTIFADEALSIGYLNGIDTFHSLLNKIGSTTPTAPSDKMANKNERYDMEFNEENFKAMEEELKIFRASNQTLQARNSTLDEKASSLEAKAGVVVTRMQEAVAQGVDAETALKMIQAETDAQASEIALNANNEDVLGTNDGGNKPLSRTEMNAKRYLAKKVRRR